MTLEEAQKPYPKLEFDVPEDWLDSCNTYEDGYSAGFEKGKLEGYSLRDEEVTGVRNGLIYCKHHRKLREADIEDEKSRLRFMLYVCHDELKYKHGGDNSPFADLLKRIRVEMGWEKP